MAKSLAEKQPIASPHGGNVGKEKTLEWKSSTTW
jgi:hypothetical protein